MNHRLGQLVNSRISRVMAVTGAIVMLSWWAEEAGFDAVRVGSAIAGLAIVLTLIVGIHEFSHLLVARGLGIGVHEFGLGLPPRAASRDWRGITWSLNWLPIGGFVKLAGESNSDEDIAAPDSFSAAPLWKRLLVWTAGPVSNLILAYVLVVILYIALYAVPPHEAAWRAIIGTAELIGLWFEGIVSLPGVLLSDPLNAPVGGLPMMGQAVDSALQHPQLIEAVLAVTLLLSLTIGLMNLLPIPPLDGGQALFAIVRAVLGERIGRVVTYSATAAGFIFIVLLGLAINGLDLVRLFGGG